MILITLSLELVSDNYCVKHYEYMSYCKWNIEHTNVVRVSPKCACGVHEYDHSKCHMFPGLRFCLNVPSCSGRLPGQAGSRRLGNHIGPPHPRCGITVIHCPANPWRAWPSLSSFVFLSSAEEPPSPSETDPNLFLSRLALS